MYGGPERWGLNLAEAPASASYDTSPGIATSAGPGFLDDLPVWHPNHPLFIFGGLLLAAAGLIGFSASGRVGPVKAAGSVGKP